MGDQFLENVYLVKFSVKDDLPTLQNTEAQELNVYVYIFIDSTVLQSWNLTLALNYQKIKTYSHQVNALELCNCI